MKNFLLSAFIVSLFFISCNSNKNSADFKEQAEIETLNQSLTKDKSEDFKTDFFAADTVAKPDGDKVEQRKQQPTNQPPANPDWDKKIIKTASLNFELKDYKAYSSALREKVKAVGGYIAQENQNQSEYKIENTVTIKVPVDQFDNALAVLTANVDKLNEKKISSQDVTAEFVDTRSRMEAKKQVRQRYMDLLKQAKNMEEILNVQSEINGIQEEIESAAGRIQYLGHSSSFSTINMTYYQVLNETAKDNDKPSFGSRLSAAFHSGWNWVGELFVGFISVWPLLLIASFVIIYFKRSFRSKAKQADA